jgi:ABC-type amino acid transport substrate-binding protein
LPRSFDVSGDAHRASPAAAQSANLTELKVAIMVVPPFVMRQDGLYTGFGIDLWNAVAAK